MHSVMQPQLEKKKLGRKGIERMPFHRFLSFLRPLLDGEHGARTSRRVKMFFSHLSWPVSYRHAQQRKRPIAFDCIQTYCCTSFVCETKHKSINLESTTVNQKRTLPPLERVGTQRWRQQTSVQYGHPPDHSYCASTDRTTRAKHIIVSVLVQRVYIPAIATLTCLLLSK